MATAYRLAKVPSFVRPVQARIRTLVAFDAAWHIDNFGAGRETFSLSLELRRSSATVPIQKLIRLSPFETQIIGKQISEGETLYGLVDVITAPPMTPIVLFGNVTGTGWIDGDYDIEVGLWAKSPNWMQLDTLRWDVPEEFLRAPHGTVLVLQPTYKNVQMRMTVL